MIELRWLVKTTEEERPCEPPGAKGPAYTHITQHRVLQFRETLKRHHWSEWHDVPEVQEEPPHESIH